MHYHYQLISVLIIDIDIVIFSILIIDWGIIIFDMLMIDTSIIWIDSHSFTFSTWSVLSSTCNYHYQKGFEVTEGITKKVEGQTDNTVAKRNRTKGQTMIVKIENKQLINWTPLKTGGERGGPGVCSRAPNKPFLPHQWHPSCICKMTQTSCDMRIVLDIWIPGNLFTSIQRYKIFHADVMAKHATIRNKKTYRKAQDNDDLSHYSGMSIMIR